MADRSGWAAGVLLGPLFIAMAVGRVVLHLLYGASVWPVGVVGVVLLGAWITWKGVLEVPNGREAVLFSTLVSWGFVIVFPILRSYPWEAPELIVLVSGLLGLMGAVGLGIAWQRELNS